MQRTTRYQYNENGEITNVVPEVDQPDFRVYPAETVERNHISFQINTCAALEGGRWEYFISYAGREDAELARKAQGIG